jgi:ATP-dependent HslUV protease ATP-binding subunit HslU
VENKILDLLTGEEASKNTRDTFRDLFRKGDLDDRVVEIEIPERRGTGSDFGAGGMPLNELVIKVGCGSVNITAHVRESQHRS